MTQIVTQMHLGLSALAADVAAIDWKLFFIWLILATVDTVCGLLRTSPGRMAEQHPQGPDWSGTRLVNPAGVIRQTAAKAIDTLIIFAILLLESSAAETLAAVGVIVPIGAPLLVTYCLKELVSLVNHAQTLPKPIAQWLEGLRRQFLSD